MGPHRTDPDAPRDPAPLPWCPSARGPHPVLPWLPEAPLPEAAPVSRLPQAAPVSPLPQAAPVSRLSVAGGVPRLPRHPSAVRALVARWGRPRLVALLVCAAVVLVGTTVALVHRGAPRVTTPFLSYSPPAGWTVEPDGADAPDAPALVGRVRGPGYDCGGEPSVRGYVGAALLPVGASAGSGPTDRAERVARWFAATSYATPGAAPALTVAAARPVRVPGPDGPVDATVTEVTATVTAAGGCAASGTVLALAAPVSGGAALLLVAGDTGGGPAQPPPPDRATLDAVLASVRLGAG